MVFTNALNIASDIEEMELEEGDILSVEDIQDMVEEALMDLNKPVAKSYINYRFLHGLARNEYDKLMEAIKEKLMADNVQNQNANVDEKSFGGRIGEASDLVNKRFALEYLVSPTTRKNHEENMVYIHDLSAYPVGSHNCMSIPFDDLLAKGFNTRQADVRPANSINTAFQLLAVIFQLQSLQQFGGCSATHLDWTMVPYVRKSFLKHYKDGLKYITRKTIEDTTNEYLKTASIKDEFYLKENKVYKYAMEMTERELNQAVEGMYHNLNTLQSRSGNQLPFTSINFGTCTLPEGRMVSKALLNGCIKGTGKFHKTSIFPCVIFQYMKGINDKKGTPNYDLKLLALKSTSLRLYPNYANVDWSGNAGYDINDPRTYFSTMGCRTANGYDINGLGQQKDGRGNIAPSTIILPTLAMIAKENILKVTNEGDKISQDELIEEFMKILNQKIEECKDSLLDRFDWISKQSPDSAKFMYENNVMAGYIPEEGIRSALRHGTLAVGMLGMAETLQILIGCNQTTEKGMKLAKRICQLYKDRCAEYKEKYKLNLGVYFTPAENLCYTAMKKFQNKYGIIKNVSDHDFFTNSVHVPVWEKLTPTEKIDIESQLDSYSSAGCILYCELDASSKNNIEAMEKIVDYAMEKDVPYFAINVPNDTCLDCGYTNEMNDICPMCGSHNIQRLRRVTG